MTRSKNSRSEEIEKLIEKYTNHIIKTYRDGLRKARIISWSNYNNYRNINTSSVLDGTTIFKTFSCKTYNINVTHLPLHRQLLTVQKTKYLDDYPYFFEEKIKGPSLILKKLTLGYLSVLYPHVFYGINGCHYIAESIDGFKFKYEKRHGILDSSTISSYYVKTNLFRIENLDIFPVNYIDGYFVGNESYIYPITSSKWIPGAITELFFTYAKNYDYRILNGLINWNQPAKKYINFAIDTPYGNPHHFQRYPNVNIANSILNRFFVVSVNDTNIDEEHHTYGFLWRHNSVRECPAILVNKRLIYQYHAIRAAKSIIEDKLTIIPGPGFTGGDLVEFKPNQSIVVKISAKELNAHNVYGVYKIRVFFVVRNNLNLTLSVLVSNVDMNASYSIGNVFHSGTHEANLDEINFSDVSYYCFKEPVLIRNKLDTSAIIIKLTNESLNDWIIIDRIEFVPHD